MTKSEMSKRFYEALYPEDDEDTSPNMSDTEVKKLLLWFEETWEVVDHGEEAFDSTDNMYQRLYGILGYLLDTGKIFYVQDEMLLELVSELCDC